jgi:murein DD-endopeptidase MepM/ murein hydrolase activator NlpD
MSSSTSAPASRFVARCRSLFAPRTVAFHDGRGIRRVRIGGAAQGTMAVATAALVGFAGYGASQAVAGEPVNGQRIAAMEHKIEGMQARVATIRKTAEIHADRIAQRQELLRAALTGEGDSKRLALAALELDPTGDKLTAHAIAPLLKIEAHQGELAALANDQLLDRYKNTRRELKKLGVSGRIATGGPLIEANSAEARASLNTDAQFRSLFMTWKKLDKLEQGVIAIPSVQPVEKLNFTSNFGIRSDPFRGTAAMHAGVDIPGPTGTPIYATADGVVAHAARQGGYGNMVEINHGKGIATRYGHLSKIIVADNTRVRRGQIIGLMGSTGRSTGPHLHYEVRIDGHAVNPVPFLTTGDYLLASQDRAVGQIPVSTTGPAPQD